MLVSARVKGEGRGYRFGARTDPQGDTSPFGTSPASVIFTARLPRYSTDSTFTLCGIN